MFASNVWRRVSTPGLAHAGYEYFMPALQYVDRRVRVGVQHETTLGAVNDRNDEHCGLSLSGSASERL